MTDYLYPLGELADIPRRPGIRGRNLVGTEHGATSLFVAELLLDQGASIPLHTHLAEEAFVVTEGMLVLRIGDSTVVAPADSVVCIPPNVPHALWNEQPSTTRALSAAAWNRATWFTEGTSYLQGQPRCDE